MEYYSALANLIETLEQYIPESEHDKIANKASECLDESLNLSSWFNQLAAFYDQGPEDSEHLSTTLNYVNLTLTELGHISNNLRNSSEAKAKFTNRARISRVSKVKVEGGTE